MTDQQSEPAWTSIVSIIICVIICVITFAAIFIWLRSASNFNLIPSLAITAVTGSIAATLLNALVQVAINAILGVQSTQGAQQSQTPKNSKDTNQ